MQDEVLVQVPEALQEHLHVTLDVLRLEDDALLHEDGLQVSLAELEHEVHVVVNEEHVHQLSTCVRARVRARVRVAYHNTYEKQ